MIDNSGAQLGEVINFGPFSLLPRQHLLAEGDRQVGLGSRALAILMVLIERAGEVVSKKELLSRVWPDTFVDESNLKVHISALRHALRDGQSGNRFVVTLPGRGYSFAAPVQTRLPAAESSPSTASGETYDIRPSSSTRMVGRSDVVDSLIATLPHRRFITLIGPGGIGKTTVARAIAERLSSSYRDHFSFVDFGPVTNPQLVPSTLAETFGLAVPSENAIPMIAGFLEAKHLLLVLDNCEHVIETAAVVAEVIHNRAPAVHILATSREPLRVPWRVCSSPGPV